MTVTTSTSAAAAYRTHRLPVRALPDCETASLYEGGGNNAVTSVASSSSLRLTRRGTSLGGPTSRDSVGSGSGTASSTERAVCPVDEVCVVGVGSYGSSFLSGGMIIAGQTTGVV
jgi:hypothetical protein